MSALGGWDFVLNLDSECSARSAAWTQLAALPALRATGLCETPLCPIPLFSTPPRQT